jgi:hypothetical protein
VAIARAGAIEPLVALVRGGSAEAQEHAAGALSNLAFDNADNRAAIARAGAIEPLVALEHGGSAGTQEHAAAALSNLAFHNADNRVAIARAHFYFNLPNTLFSVVAGALLTFAVYQRSTRGGLPDLGPCKREGQRRKLRVDGEGGRQARRRRPRRTKHRWIRTERGLRKKQPSTRLQRLRPLP